MNKFSLVLVCLALVNGVLAATEVATDDDQNEPLKYVVTSEAWFDVGVKRVKSDDDDTTQHLGRVTIGLFGDIVPMTATNFAQLAKGFKKGDVSVLVLFLGVLVVSAQLYMA